jgi:hypothetical protein
MRCCAFFPRARYRRRSDRTSVGRAPHAEQRSRRRSDVTSIDP